MRAAAMAITPTLATGTRDGSARGPVLERFGRERNRASGFTLIEVLVVVAIAGIVVALAVVNLLPGDIEVGRREAGRMALTLERARDAAWFGGRPTGISFDDAGVHAWRYAGDRWAPDAEHDARFPERVQVNGLYVDGQALPNGARLVFLPDGLGVPFRVALDVRGLPWAVEGDAAGSVTVVER